MLNHLLQVISAHSKHENSNNTTSGLRIMLVQVPGCQTIMRCKAVWFKGRPYTGRSGPIMGNPMFSCHGPKSPLTIGTSITSLCCYGTAKMIQMYWIINILWYITTNACATLQRRNSIKQPTLQLCNCSSNVSTVAS